MSSKEISEKSVEALETELKEATRHLFDLRTQAVTEKLEDPSQLGKTKRGIARLKTDLRRRELDKAAAK